MLHNNGAEDCTIDMTDSKEEIAILSSSHGPLPEQNPLRKKKIAARILVSDIPDFHCLGEDQSGICSFWALG